MTVLAVLAAAAAAWLLLPPCRVSGALPRVPAARASSAAGAGLVVRGRWWWAGSAFVAGLVFGPGRWAPVVGVAAALTVWVLVDRAEPPEARRRRAQAARQLPHLVELLAASLASGAAPEEALSAACAALPGPAADELRGARAALGLGVAPGEVWRELAEHPALAPLGRTLARSQESGAPVVEAVRRLADDLAETTRLDAEDRARAVGVRAALPLGLCLLPAFLLLGIVPLVAGAVSALHW